MPGCRSIFLERAGSISIRPIASLETTNFLIPRRSCMAPSKCPAIVGTFTGALGSALKMQVDVTVTEEFGSRVQTAARGMT